MGDRCLGFHVLTRSGNRKLLGFISYARRRENNVNEAEAPINRNSNLMIEISL